MGWGGLGWGIGGVGYNGGLILALSNTVLFFMGLPHPIIVHVLYYSTGGNPTPFLQGGILQICSNTLCEPSA